MANFQIPLDIPSLEIITQSYDNKRKIILTVESNNTETTCHKCGKPATKRYGHSAPIEIRHLPVLDTPVYLRIKPVRYQCEHCDGHPITTEKYDWCDQKTGITKGLENYLIRRLINSTIEDVSKKEKIGYRVIESAVNRLINTEVDWSEYTDLHTLGIDEISNRKGYQDFIGIISAKDKKGRLSILAVLDDRKQDTVKEFFESIPEHLRKTVKSVCTDMHDGFVYPAIEIFGKQAVVIDRYHVAQLYRKALDKLRIKEMARIKNEISAEEYAQLENMMWIFRKQHECLTKADKTKLELLYKHSPKLKEAHGSALRLTQIFNTHSDRKSAMAKIERWIENVEKSDLNCFNGFIKTLTKYKGSIANYFKSRKNSGFVEGLNNKIKVIKRRCYGFTKTESLFQRLVLDLQGYRMAEI
jgi:transposase